MKKYTEIVRGLQVCATVMDHNGPERNVAFRARADYIWVTQLRTAAERSSSLSALHSIYSTVLRAILNRSKA